MLEHIKKILQDMGWTDGYHIPVANKENLELEAEIERLTIAKAKKTLALDALTSKCSALEKHLKHVQTEKEQNQTLIVARQSELSAEKVIYMTVKMDKEKTASEIKTYGKELEDADARKQAKLKDLNKIIANTNKLKASIEWDEHSMDEWEEQLLKKDEDNEIIKKFSEEDKKKAKDLEIKRQRLQEEFVNRRKLVIKTSKELDSLKLILTKSVQVYKQMHEERRDLVKQWQEAVKNLQQRDKDTLRANREIIATKELIEAKLENLEQEKQFHQNELNNNAELQVQIEQGTSEVAKLRKDLQNNHHVMNEYNMQLDSAKRELKSTADMLASVRIEMKNLNNEYLQRQKQLETTTLKVQKLKVQEQNARDTRLTAEERVKKLQEMINSEEVIHKGFLVDIECIQHTLYRSQTQYNDLIDFHKVQTMAAHAHEQGIQLLEKETKNKNKELDTQRETSYKIAFKLAMIESRVTRMEGTGETIDGGELENLSTLDELQAKCKDVMDLSTLLQTQVDRLEDVMRSVTTAIAADIDRILNMKGKLQDQILSVEGAQKAVKVKKETNNQYQVEENVMKVRHKHAENQLNEEGHSIYNIQRQQLELESMMKEREAEIVINREILNVKKNALQEDNSRMRRDIQGRKMKIEMLKKRLDLIISTLGKAEDGETVSVAYFKVKNAQEKYLIQEEGDKLDNLIRNAEKEIIAMENTLKAINFSNDSVRRSLSLVEEQDDETTEMNELENELHIQTKMLCKNRNELVALQEKLRQIQEIVNEKQEQINTIQQEITEQQNEYATLQNEAFHRKCKLERTETLIRKTINGKELNEMQKRDFITRQLQDFNRSALQQLSETSVKYLETKPTINHYLAENNLSLSLTSLRSNVSTKSYSSISYTTPVTNRSLASIPSVSPTLNVPK